MIRIFTDGGSRGNPGLAGAGAVLFDEKGALLKEGSKFLGTMTNNEAEYEAVLLGLSLAKAHFGKVKLKELSLEVCLDSELVARQLSLRYQVKEPRLFPYFVAISNLRSAPACRQAGEFRVDIRV
jgi:ribonuclease HI